MGAAVPAPAPFPRTGGSIYKDKVAQRAAAKRCRDRRRSRPDAMRRVRASTIECKTNILKGSALPYLELHENDPCHICGREPGTSGRGRSHVDHDHATGVIRGMLCHGCNISLGYFQDNPETLLQAVRYLEGAR